MGSHLFHSQDTNWFYAMMVFLGRTPFLSLFLYGMRMFVVLAALLVGGAGYHEPYARDARVRIIAFFRTHLVDAPAKV